MESESEVGKEIRNQFNEFRSTNALIMCNLSDRIKAVEGQVSDTHKNVIKINEDVGYIKGVLKIKANRTEVLKENKRVLLGIISLLTSVLVALVIFIIKGCA
ncbi:hypothetical protein A2V94_07060 [Candidatus Atribacteria bacterium RBG_16_35_8]|nr:MAG: hypothetical protein A2V94_07060 [Candidatus Atribacteria bacterium RBG_16_35_8]